MTEILVIVNPTAGGGKAMQKWEQAEKHLRSEGAAFDVAFTGRYGHAVELAREGTDAGYGLLLAVGGDGTVHETANGVMRSGRPKEERPALATIPVGTGVDFARTLDMPHDPVEACRRILSGQRRRVDLIEIGYTRDGAQQVRYAVNECGLGFDAEVVETANRLDKRWGGTIPYLLAVVKSLAVLRSYHVSIRVDGGEAEERLIALTTICNGSTFGGGMKIGPGALVDDGLLDVVIVNEISRAELLANFPRIYRGTHIHHPKIDYFRASSIEITHPHGAHDTSPSIPHMPFIPIKIHADGDIVGNTPVRFRVIPSALEVVT